MIDLKKFPYRKIVVDIDGTLCEDTKGLNYDDAPPKRDVITWVNELHAAGIYVIIFTARGMHSCNGDVEMIEQRFRHITTRWLERHGVMFDRLVFGKPSADVYLDDKGLRPDELVP